MSLMGEQFVSEGGTLSFQGLRNLRSSEVAFSFSAPEVSKVGSNEIESPLLDNGRAL